MNSAIFSICADMGLSVGLWYLNQMSRNQFDVPAGFKKTCLSPPSPKLSGQGGKNTVAGHFNARATRTRPRAAIWLDAIPTRTVARRRGRPEWTNRDATTEFPK